MYTSNWSRVSLIILSLLVAGFIIPAFGQVNQIPLNSSDNETAQAWFVELSSPPTADGTRLATVKNEKAAFRKAAAAAGLNYKERLAFDNLWNGLSVTIPASQVSILARIPGVKNIYPVVRFAPDPIKGTEGIDITNAITMTGADVVQSELGFTGKGVKVGVIDTGIDYGHPDLGGCFGSNCRVVGGYDFVGDAYDANTNPNPVPDNNPMDCNGHGTHVAGIIGANGAIKGVAPDVTYYAYRVFGCSGSTESDIMIAAMERALADHVQLINMSIGSAFQWPQYPTAQASDRLVNKKIVVVASIGNDGASGLYSAGAPGVGKKVIGVASFDNTKVYQPYFTVSPDAKAIGYIGATGSPTAPTSGNFPMARTGTVSSTADACSALTPGSLTGKVALIRRGTCSFYIKASNAQNAGAAAVVLYNNTSGILNPTVAGTPAITIPVVAIQNTDGAVIDSRLASGSVDLTWTTESAYFADPNGGLISSFSSYGVAADLSLKPDIGAPGGNIRSTYPTWLGGYAILSGTSMSSPHVAGAVALLLQAHPHTPSNAVRDILENSAEPKNWFGNPGLGYLDNVNRQGAGMLKIDKAILATTRIEPGKLSLGESQFGPITQTLTVTNNGDHQVTYNLSYVNALSVANTFSPGFATSNGAVTFNSPSVTIPVGGSVPVTFTITAPTGPAKAQFGGYVVLTDADDSANLYRVPYSGFVGDYQSIQALAPTSYGFPWLARLSGSSYVNQPSGSAYSLTGGDVPYFLFHFDHQVAAFRLNVYDANSGKDWHLAYSENYLGRNSTAAGFFALSWDGTTFNGGGKLYTVPNGQYTVKLSVLKALGDPNNPADWETWTSPTIIIARP